MYEFKAPDGSVTLSMYRLKFYHDEQGKFREAYNRNISGKEVEIVFSKLKRHYKLSQWLRFNGSTRGHFRGHCIDVPYNTSIGLLCHEVSHAIDSKKRRTKHDKRLMRILGRVVNYCKKKNYWEEELNKRTEIKIKTEPTKEELRTKRIEKRKNDLERYKKRLAYFQKLYSNKIKKANRSIMMLERII